MSSSIGDEAPFAAAGHEAVSDSVVGPVAIGTGELTLVRAGELAGIHPPEPVAGGTEIDPGVTRAPIVTGTVTGAGGTDTGATMIGGSWTGRIVIGGIVIGGTVIGGTVIGGTVIGGTVIGGIVVGGTVIGGTVIGGTVIGGSVTMGSTAGDSMATGRTMVERDVSVGVEEAGAAPAPAPRTKTAKRTAPELATTARR